MGVGRELSVHSQDLLDACRRGDIEKVTTLVHLRKNKKSKALSLFRPATPATGWLCALRDPSNFHTLLHLAALHGYAEVTKLLIDNDSQLLTTRDRRGCIPVHLAAWNGHHEVVQLMIDAEPETVDSVNNAKESPLHLSAQHGHAKVVSVLLHKHADARLRNARSETALDVAARLGKANVCRLLISNCPELALQSAAESSSSENRPARVVYPLHSAARHGHIDCLQILCQSGFEVNYVTDEGSALHVAALFGQLEAVKLLLSRDSQGRTVLQTLDEHQKQKASDLTQVIQSRDGWSECKSLIEGSLNFAVAEGNIQSARRHGPNSDNTSSQSNLYQNYNDLAGTSSDVVWRPVPEGSAARRQTSQLSKTGSQCSNGVYHPPSMTADVVNLSEDGDESVISASSIVSASPLGDNESIGHDKISNVSIASTSIASSVKTTLSMNPQRTMPKFPITSPNSKSRHQSSKRFGDYEPAVVIPQRTDRVVPQECSTLQVGCSYQGPPLYDAWCPPPCGNYDNMSQPIHPHLAYDNVRKNMLVYDNAPPPGHRKWEHCCSNSGGTVRPPGARNGRPSAVREDGTQTLPMKQLPNARPTILPADYKNAGKNKSHRNELEDYCEKGIAELSIASPKRTSSRTSVVTFSCSTLERSVSPEKRTFSLSEGRAPLALPEELYGSTCTSITSMSPERSLPVDKDRWRRSSTVHTDSTVVSSSSTRAGSEPKTDRTRDQAPADPVLHQPPSPTTSQSTIHNVLCSNEDLRRRLSRSPVHMSVDQQTQVGCLVSPTSTEYSDCTIGSSCSLPVISQISSTASSLSSPIRQGNISVDLEPESPDVKMRSNESIVRRPKDRAGSTILNESVEWKKIEDILGSYGGAICRESVFADKYEPQVAVFLRDRRSQALTLQLNNLSSPKAEKHVDFSELDERSVSDEKERTHRSTHNGGELSSVAEWLNVSVGIPNPRAKEVAVVLERNGFDNIHHMKGCLDRASMVEMGLDKSIQHNLATYLENYPNSPEKSADQFTYVSDWLLALDLQDYLGLFMNNSLSSMLLVSAADLNPKHLKKMGISLTGHIRRIMVSLDEARRERLSRASMRDDDTDVDNRSVCFDLCSSASSLMSRRDMPIRNDHSEWKNAPESLISDCVSFSAHYLGSMEISNIEGTDDARRAMIKLKKGIREIAKVPQVVLEISVEGVSVLDASTKQLTVQHEINRIQIVCQDERDLNCFAYISQDGDKHFCHVYCVLTADVATEIIITLGQAFELAYRISTAESVK
uniref:ANK_REP_REGION domain-containing protein n=1 Tax=Steinernema glaseri TaxID=37863 RepID=A0A1I7ZED9_9BILA